MPDTEIIKKVCSSLSVSTGKLSCHNKQTISRTVLNLDNAKVTVTGLITILNNLAKESTTKIAANSTNSPEIVAQVYQWIEYAITYVALAIKNKNLVPVIFQELNFALATKSYLVEQCLTVADLVLFYVIYNLMGSLTPVEKETYLNLSRWFNHLQQKPEVRQDADLINFTAIFLHACSNMKLCNKTM